MLKLELMDWKEVERVSEEALRGAMIATILHQKTIDLAKKEIKALGGKTSEQEAATAKTTEDKRKKSRNSIVG